MNDMIKILFIWNIKSPVEQGEWILRIKHVSKVKVLITQKVSHLSCDNIIFFPFHCIISLCDIDLSLHIPLCLPRNFFPNWYSLPRIVTWLVFYQQDFQNFSGKTNIFFYHYLISWWRMIWSCFTESNLATTFPYVHSK